MSPVGKALWFIESHFAQDLSLEKIAGVSGVSRYHMAHVFSLATGMSAI
jgi:AraC family transcriptional regulator